MDVTSLSLHLRNHSGSRDSLLRPTLGRTPACLHLSLTSLSSPFLHFPPSVLSNLVSPPEPWRAVVQGHFKNKGPSIIKLLDKWLEEDDGRALAGDGHVYMNQPAGPPANPTQAAASLAAVRAAFPSGGKNTRSSAAALAEASPPTKFGKDGESKL